MSSPLPPVKMTSPAMANFEPLPGPSGDPPAEEYVPLSPSEKKKKKKKEKKEKKDDDTSSSSSSSSSGSSSSSSSGFFGDVEDFFEGKYFKHVNFEEELDKAINESKVPRDAQTEKRCQMFSVFVTLLSLLAIFFFAMTKPVWTTTIPPDYYKSLCSIEDVIPIHGTAECNSVRSRDHTKVHCVISCTNGVNEDAVDENFVMNADGTSFNLTCDKGRNAWTYEVNSICT